tara:strand:- start:238 stop:690 length:453 start_codon:yes stop_codon:yes gene_type:complete
MAILDDYLNDFYNDPYNVEEYKINFLKNHYYPIINIFLNCEFQNFQIGVTKNKSIIWFTNKKNPNYEIIYNYISKKYYEDINKKRELNEIKIEYSKLENIENYEYNEASNNIDNNIYMFFRNCRINILFYSVKRCILKLFLSRSVKITPI